MRFVIVGAGRVGLRTARVLAEEGHDVTLVERDGPIAERARTEGFTVIEGDGSREDVLREAGLERADALGALSGDLNANFTACLIADHLGCRTVMRIDEDYREEIYRNYASQVDEIIYPERLGAITTKNALLGGSVRAIADIAQNLQVVELTVGGTSPIKGYTISELELPANARVLAFGKHDGKMGIPLADDSIDEGDKIAVLADFKVLEGVKQIIVGEHSAPTIGGT